MSAGTADGNWRDLSGTELRQRLERRGVPPVTAANLVAHRDRREPARTISRILTR